MRKYCLNCVRKHLGKAEAKFNEFLRGDYDEHFWLAIGEMAEAEDECIVEYPQLAALIREERIKAMEEDDYFVDIVALIRETTKLAILETKKGKKKNE